jgi:hypothetical protein
MLSAADSPAVSTILEEMFQFVDGRIRARGEYKSISKMTRLRLALIAFNEEGLSRLDTTMAPRPMVVPTPKLLEMLLDSSRLTTSVEPLVLCAVPGRISQQEESRQRQYTRALKSAMASEIDNFIDGLAVMLHMWEFGWARPSRESNGKLVWHLSKKGKKLWLRKGAKKHVHRQVQ